MSKTAKRDRSASVPRPAGGRRGSLRLAWLVGAGTLGLAVLAASLLLPNGGSKASRAYALAPEGALPPNVRQAPPAVREAYRFAIANRDILRQIPCYCGCGPQHESNAECYIKAVRADGSFVFDDMSLG